mmetsp:Transcript_17891/g.34147  ORF Transcript_17891/g.34147 Transcript_17891/m.34147 type:complete len:81 (-) Transcript_17891:1696-1938(-)
MIILLYQNQKISRHRMVLSVQKKVSGFHKIQTAISHVSNENPTACAIEIKVKFQAPQTLFSRPHHHRGIMSADVSSLSLS